jgi:hypothetical protein
MGVYRILIGGPWGQCFPGANQILVHSDLRQIEVATAQLKQRWEAAGRAVEAATLFLCNIWRGRLWNTFWKGIAMQDGARTVISERSWSVAIGKFVLLVFSCQVQSSKKV